MKTGTWDTLKIHPAKLMKMVVEGKAKIVGRDKYGRRVYGVHNDNYSRTR